MLTIATPNARNQTFGLFTTEKKVRSLIFRCLFRIGQYAYKFSSVPLIGIYVGGKVLLARVPLLFIMRNDICLSRELFMDE